jgi:hypothetical protein
MIFLRDNTVKATKKLLTNMHVGKEKQSFKAVLCGDKY